MPRERKLAGFLRSWTQPLLKLLASVVLTLVLLEASVWLLGVAGVLPPEAHGADAASRKFWHGRHEAFGVWHHPNSSMRHQRECFDVEYRSNSVGARDAERSREASGPRVVVLGDSLIEGWACRTKSASRIGSSATPGSRI